MDPDPSTGRRLHLPPGGRRRNKRRSRSAKGHAGRLVAPHGHAEDIKTILQRHPGPPGHRSAYQLFPIPIAATAGTSPRSEEHKSELPSLMRLSSAGFSLKKKTQQQKYQYKYT